MECSPAWEGTQAAGAGWGGAAAGVGRSQSNQNPGHPEQSGWAQMDPCPPKHLARI